MSAQDAERKAYRKWYHAHEPQSVKDARKAWKKTPQGQRCARNVWLKKAYGITIEDKERMLRSQNGVCAIMGEPLDLYRAHVDHNHASGKVRALLCTRCNTRLVSLENAEYKEKAQAYLAKWD